VSTSEAHVHPFEIAIADADLQDLQERLAQTRWPARLPGAGWERGVPQDYLERLVAYWRDEFDWREQQRKLNTFPQFVTTIDGQQIHFLHVRSPEAGALPLVMTHGYPGSVVEFMDVIGPLSDPRAHGGDAADAFHLVLPSLPGFGFSAPLREPGWEAARTARAWVELMHRLGYESYVAQGGDIGAGVTGMLGAVDPDGVRATHVNTDPLATALIGDRIGVDLDAFAASGLSTSDRERVEFLARYAAEGKGYLLLQGTRPQSIAYALTDSPVAQLTWIAEKFREWTNPAAELPEQAVDRDQLLTNVSLYWFTATGASAANFLYEAAHSGEWLEPSRTPQGWAVFAADDITRRLLDPGRRIEHWSQFDRGGHFAAMEAPDLLVDDMRNYFRKYRVSARDKERGARSDRAVSRSKR
jgi:pimeloyl-ACP methyl ester carboxylesterase